MRSLLIFGIGFFTVFAAGMFYLAAMWNKRYPR